MCGYQMYQYRAYGLGIHSAIPLPELQALAGAPADVVIKFGKGADRELVSAAGVSEQFCFDGHSAYLSWDQLGRFEVRRGAEILIDRHPGVCDRLIRLPLLGAVLSIVLYQRGYLVFHASAVQLNGAAIAFVGGKGFGKSTMAASLYSRGHTLLADDSVAVDVSDPARPLVLPGFPQLKLWPEAAAFSLGDDPEDLPPLAAGYDKRSRKIGSNFGQEPVPLKSVYVLSEGPAPALTRLKPQEAIVQLIGQSYVSRFGKSLLHGRNASEHLHQCASLASNIGVYRLERPLSFPLLQATSILLEGADHRAAG